MQQLQMSRDILCVQDFRKHFEMKFWNLWRDTEMYLGIIFWSLYTRGNFSLTPSQLLGKKPWKKG